MSDEQARTITLAEDFYQGLLEIQTYTDAHGGRGRQLISALMDFAYQIIGSAPQAYPVLSVPAHPKQEFRRAVFRRRYVLIYQLTATEILFLLVYSTRQNPPALPLTT